VGTKAVHTCEYAPIDSQNGVQTNSTLQVYAT
jgi:hypothetical protein